MGVHAGAWFLICALMVLVSVSRASAADDLGNDACLACHGGEGFAGPNGRPLYIDPAVFNASVHAILPCSGCHTDATTIPHPEKLHKVGPQTCATCHSDVVSAYDKGIHGRARNNGVTEAATCTSCHGTPHGIRKATDPGSPVYQLNLPRTCGKCHGDRALAKRYGIPVVDAYQLYLDSIHGRALTRSGLLVAANCASCHGAHEILPRDNPHSKVYRSNIPATCGACHAGVEKSYFEGSHGEGLKEGNPKVPTCITCHTAHSIARTSTPAWQVRVVGECGSCHKQSLRTYRDTFHGQVTALGFTAVARCADCHEAHRILPASNPASSIAPRHLASTCRKCHPEANGNFVHYMPHADPHDRVHYPGVYYATLFMNILIIGVFAFFGLHTILWFSRSGLLRRWHEQRERRRRHEQDGREH